MLQKSKGAISIFLIIITLSSLIFGGLFIDAARILLAEMKVQNALNSATRSSLSYYDENLVSEYGLYGISQEQADNQLAKYFMNNLLISKNDNLNLLTLEIDESATSITVDKPLIAKDVETFQKQVLEYSKYKAPILITVGAIGKFKGIFTPQKAELLTGESTSTQAITFNYDIFKNDVKKLREALVEKLKDKLGTALKNRIDNAINKSQNKVNSEIDNTIIQLDDANDQLQLTENKIIKFRQQALTMASEAQKTAEDDGIVQDTQENKETSYDKALRQINEMKAQISENKNELLEIQKELNKILPEYHQTKNEIRDLQNSISVIQNQDPPGDTSGLRESLKKAEDKETELKKKMQPYIDRSAEITVNVDKIEEIQVKLTDDTVGEKTQLQGEREQYQKDLEAKLNESIKKSIGTYRITLQQRQANSEQNQTTYSNEDEKDLTNSMSKSFENEETAKTGFKGMLDFYKKIKAALEAARDDIYVTEYIMDKCTYLTSQTPRNHYFKFGEVEYIIFGNDYEWANITSAIITVSLIRMVINTVYYFVKIPDPEPISHICTALAEGALQTAKDMLNMIFIFNSDQKAETGIIPYSNIKVTYSDHLRLILLLKLNSINGLQDTMRATLMTLKPSVDLLELNTQVHATAKVKVNLIFVPIIGEKVNFGNFNHGKYIITKTITMGY